MKLWDNFKGYLFRRMIGMKPNEMDLRAYDNRSEVEKWVNLYKGESHGYEEDKLGRSLAATLASYISTKATIEFESNVVGAYEFGSKNEYANYIDSNYQHIVKRTRTMLEHLLVQGSGILKPFVFKDKIGIEYIRGGNFIPVKFNEIDELVEVLFLIPLKKGNEQFTRIEHHKLNDDGTYEIKNTAHVGSGVDISGTLTKEIPLSYIPEWSYLETLVILENISKPFYVYMKTPFANNKDVNSPLGVSLFSRIEGYLKDYDEMYARYKWEFEGSELKILTASEYLQNFEVNNGSGLKWDKKNKLFVSFDINTAVDQGNRIEVFSPAIREQELKEGMNEIKRNIEFNVGLAYGELSNVNTVEKTAEEIRASKERSYATITDIQKIITSSYSELVEIMANLADLYELTPAAKGDYEVTFNFDDSIVSDRRYISSMLDEVKSGILRKEYYLMERYGLTLEEARERIPEDTL